MNMKDTITQPIIVLDIVLSVITVTVVPSFAPFQRRRLKEDRSISQRNAWI